MVVFGAKLTASVVQSWSAPSHQALMKWSHDVTPPSPGACRHVTIYYQLKCVSSFYKCDLVNCLVPEKMNWQGILKSFLSMLGSGR